MLLRLLCRCSRQWILFGRVFIDVDEMEWVLAVVTRGATGAESKVVLFGSARAKVGGRRRAFRLGSFRGAKQQKKGQWEGKVKGFAWKEMERVGKGE